MMLINIRTNYSILILTIQKDQKNKTINLRKVILQIIKYFKFIEGNKKTYNIMQNSNTNPSIYYTLKNSCINPKYIEKEFIIHYTNCSQIKHPELQAKYTFGQICSCKSQKNLQEDSAVALKIKAKKTSKKTVDNQKSRQ